MELVENEAFDQAGRYLREHFSAFDMAHVDAVVLGCTHYVFLRHVLAKILPPHIQVMDGNAGTARQLARVLEGGGLKRLEGQGSVELETSGDPAIVVPQMKRLLALAQLSMS